MLRIRIKQGKGGQWRWHLYDAEDKHAGMSTIRGFFSYNDAVWAAKKHFGDGVELVLSSGLSDMDWPLHAGARDWAD